MGIKVIHFYATPRFCGRQSTPRKAKFKSKTIRILDEKPEILRIPEFTPDLQSYAKFELRWWINLLFFGVALNLNIKIHE